MKRRLVAIVFFLVGLSLFLGTNQAAADPVSSADAKAIQAVVRSQLQAFAEDDAAKAFSLATDETRSRIGSADTFMQIIKNDYDPIYRNHDPIFAPAEVIDGNTIQIVRLADRDNVVWIAIYKLERDHGGNWKIQGCELLQTTSVSV
jgi:hypothetical protein